MSLVTIDLEAGYDCLLAGISLAINDLVVKEDTRLVGLDGQSDA